LPNLGRSNVLNVFIITPVAAGVVGC